MLKIKDNVDLKELEKFGFEKIHKLEINDKMEFVQGSLTSYSDGKYIVKAKGKQIISFGSLKAENVYDTLFDLIKAGLVEKV